MLERVLCLAWDRPGWLSLADLAEASDVTSVWGRTSGAQVLGRTSSAWHAAASLACLDCSTVP